jgi:hypothetical protein
MKLPYPKITLHTQGLDTEVAFVDINQVEQIITEITQKYRALRTLCANELESIPDWYLPYCDYTLSLLEVINGNYHTGTQDFHLLLCLYEMRAIEEELDRNTTLEIQDAIKDIKLFIANHINLQEKLVNNDTP